MTGRCCCRVSVDIVRGHACMIVCMFVCTSVCVGGVCVSVCICVCVCGWSFCVCDMYVHTSKIYI